METINILCVDDQRTVLSAICTDLEYFEAYFNVEACESAQEALALIEELDQRGEQIALIISDHVMPGKTGVEFLIEINDDPRFSHVRKILLTGLATHQDTIVAINKANIDRFIEKPYNPEVLIGTVKSLLTEYLLEIGLDYTKYAAVLDQELLLSHMRKSTF